jgi:hypothetical protein
MKAVNNVNFKTVKEFVSHHLLANQHVRTDAYPALNIIYKTLEHEPRVTPSEKVDEWLPWVHIAIGNLKTFLLGTFHGVTGNYLQEYLNDFVIGIIAVLWKNEYLSIVKLGNYSYSFKIKLSQVEKHVTLIIVRQ